jgi:hypothetical protein
MLHGRWLVGLLVLLGGKEWVCRTPYPTGADRDTGEDQGDSDDPSARPALALGIAPGHE